MAGHFPACRNVSNAVVASKHFEPPVHVWSHALNHVVQQRLFAVPATRCDDYRGLRDIDWRPRKVPARPYHQILVLHSDGSAQPNFVLDPDDVGAPIIKTP